MRKGTMMDVLIYSFILTALKVHSTLAEGVQCGQPGRPANGTVSPQGRLYFPGEKITYSCLEGFVLFGEEGRTCAKNGTWSGQVPLCDFNLAKGKRTLQSATLWSYLPGLAVDGNRATCSFTPKGPDSRWWQVHLGHKFNVVAIGVTISPGSLQEFTIFVIELLSDNKALYKPCIEFKGVFQTHKGLFKCNDGLGHPGQYVYIRDDRKQEQYFGLCEVEVFAFRERIPCGDPAVPVSGEVSRAKENEALYACETGYKLEEGDAQITCSSKGDWQGHIPKCNKVTCSAPHHIENGFIEIGNPRGEYLYGTEAVYGCNPGFVLRGDSTRVCDHREVWSKEAPSCQAVNCGSPPEFENTKFIYLNSTKSTSQQNGIVVYTCLDGFKLLSDEEDTVTTCLDTGEWRPVNITCVLFVNNVKFIVRETESRALDYTVKKFQTDSETSPAVIALATIAALLASGMALVGFLFLRRRFHSDLGALSPPMTRPVVSDNGNLCTKIKPGDTITPVPQIGTLGKPNHFQANLLQSIQDCKNNRNYTSCIDGSNTALDSRSHTTIDESVPNVEPPYEQVLSEHSYETLRKKSLPNKCLEEGDSSSSHDTNYESVSSDKESVGYETVSSPKEQAVVNTEDPGYDVLKNDKDPGYEVVQEPKIPDTGYETVGHEVPDHGYEIVKNSSNRVHGYETIKPKLPPRDTEKDSVSVPDILQNLTTELPPSLKEDVPPVAAASEIPSDILALYAKIDKSKKNRKPKPLSPSSSVLIPDTPPPSSHKSSWKESFNTFSKAILSNPKEASDSTLNNAKAKELIQKFNSWNSEDDSRSLSPPASLNSDSLSTGSMRGSLRPLPPLPK